MKNAQLTTVDNLLHPNTLKVNYQNSETIKDSILSQYFDPLDNSEPACRFRGTIIDNRNIVDGSIKIIAWQRNTARIRKLDVSLPTFITLKLSKEEVIEEITLDTSFKGSKGLYCSHKYLNRVLTSKLAGTKFDKSFVSKVKVNNIYCYHLFETLSGAYSFYQLTNTRNKGNLNRQFFKEEEVLDGYMDENSVILSGSHELIESKLKHAIVFNDLQSRVSFNKKGYLNIEKEVFVDFFIDNELLHSKCVLIKADNFYLDLQKFMIECISLIRERLAPELSQMYNTNLYPVAYIGLLVQRLAIKTFKNNYNYVSHVLTAIQRHNNTPSCIGAIKDFDEAEKHFPGYSISDLV